MHRAEWRVSDNRPGSGGHRERKHEAGRDNNRRTYDAPCGCSTRQSRSAACAHPASGGSGVQGRQVSYDAEGRTDAMPRCRDAAMPRIETRIGWALAHRSFTFTPVRALVVTQGTPCGARCAATGASRLVPCPGSRACGRSGSLIGLSWGMGGASRRGTRNREWRARGGVQATVGQGPPYAGACVECPTLI